MHQYLDGSTLTLTKLYMATEKCTEGTQNLIGVHDVKQSCYQ